MTHEDLLEYIDDLFLRLKELEDRIRLLERKGEASSRPSSAPLPSDNWYWEHG